MVIPVSIARLTNNKAVLAQGMAIYSRKQSPGWRKYGFVEKNTGYEQVKPDGKPTIKFENSQSCHQ